MSAARFNFRPSQGRQAGNRARDRDIAECDRSRVAPGRGMAEGGAAAAPAR